MPFLIALIPALLQFEPEAAKLIHDLFASGQTAPSPDQLADLYAKRADRIVAQAQFEADANGK